VQVGLDHQVVATGVNDALARGKNDFASAFQTAYRLHNEKAGVTEEVVAHSGFSKTAAKKGATHRKGVVDAEKVVKTSRGDFVLLKPAHFVEGGVVEEPEGGFTNVWEKVPLWLGRAMKDVAEGVASDYVVDLEHWVTRDGKLDAAWFHPVWAEGCLPQDVGKKVVAKLERGSVCSAPFQLNKNKKVPDKVWKAVMSTPGVGRLAELSRVKF